MCHESCLVLFCGGLWITGTALAGGADNAVVDNVSVNHKRPGVAERGNEVGDWNARV